MVWEKSLWVNIKKNSWDEPDSYENPSILLYALLYAQKAPLYHFSSKIKYFCWTYQQFIDRDWNKTVAGNWSLTTTTVIEMNCSYQMQSKTVFVVSI